MAKTSNIFARVEPEIKEQAEIILEHLGIPMSNAISIFLRQIVLQRGIPFDMKLPQYTMTDMSALSDEEFNMEIEKGLDDMRSGKVIPAETVAENMKREYGI